MENISPFDKLSAINCNEHIEKKNGLSYLPWAWAWYWFKKTFPEANYIVYEAEDGRPYFTDGRTCWVKVGVIINGIEHIEYLPIMDYNNRSIPLEKVTSMDMNKAIQRALTKACARHGLGLYVYAGEDLPEDFKEDAEKVAETPVEAPKPTRARVRPPRANKEPQAPVSAPAKKMVTDENIKKIVDWVCAVPEGIQREERVAKAEDSYEWPGNLLEAFHAMVDLTA